MNPKKIKFLGVCSGICAPTAKGKIGAELGFDSLRAISLRERLDLFNPDRTERIVDINELFQYINTHKAQFSKDIEPPKENVKNTNYCRHIEYLNKVAFPKIISNIKSTLDEGYFPFVIAGDHSTSAATIGGIKKYLGKNKKLGVIWVDAHVDGHTPYSTPSGNMHGMPIGMALNLRRNMATTQPDNELSEDQTKAWDKLCRTLGDGPLITTNDIVYIGIRSWEPHEAALLQGDEQSPPAKYFQLTRPDEKDMNSAPITLEEGRYGKLVNGKYGEFGEFSEKNSKHLRNYTLESACKTILENYFAGYDALYISFDIDSIDGDIVPGTGTGVRYGLGVDEAKYILKYFWDNKKVPMIAFEMVEVSPLLDHKNKTAKTAFEILEHLIPNPQKES